MTQIDRRVSHEDAAANGNHVRRAPFGSVRMTRARRVFDGVVASYIRDIATDPSVPRPEPR
jgi:hypothetical protein